MSRGRRSTRPGMSSPAGRGRQESAEADAAAAAEQRRQRRYLVKALLRSPTFMIGLVIVLFWVFMALFSTVITQDPFAAERLRSRCKSPSPAHWFGTDDLGRDVFARTMAGARTVLIIAPLATLLALAVGRHHRPHRRLLPRPHRRHHHAPRRRAAGAADHHHLDPHPVAARQVARPSSSSSSARCSRRSSAAPIRSAVIGEREREYVMAARLRGERSAFVMAREILPNITQPIIVEGTVRLGYAVFTAATLSFLGFGLEPPSPDWGLTIATERIYLQIAPWTVLFPAARPGVARGGREPHHRRPGHGRSRNEHRGASQCQPRRRTPRRSTSATSRSRSIAAAATCRCSRASRCASSPARPTAWSASRAAARPPWPWRPCATWPPTARSTPARCSSTARTSAR